MAAAAAARGGAASLAALTSRELAFTAAVLVGDAKNYHAWAHRGWAVAAGGAWDQELQYTSAMIADDARNNSAWHARLSVLTRRTHPAASSSSAAALPADVALRELAFAAAALRAAPGNESAWAFARGIAEAAGGDADVAGAASALRAEGVARGDAHGAAAAADAAAAAAAAAAARGDGAGAAAAAEAAREGFARLAAADPVRAHYWAFRAAEAAQAAAPA